MTTARDIMHAGPTCVGEHEIAQFVKAIYSPPRHLMTISARAGT